MGNAAKQVIGEQLRIAESRYRQLFGNIPDGIVIVDLLTHQIVDANPAVAALLGISPEQVIGRTLWQMGLFADKEAYQKALSSLRRQQMIRFPSRILQTDAGQRDVEMVCSLYPVDQHQMLQCTLHDVTERRQWEVARLHLAAIVESSDDAILSKDLDGIVTSWNAAAERMFGYRAEEMIGQSVTCIYPPERQRELDQILEHIRNGERFEHYETTRINKEGRRLMVSVTVSPVKDSSGTIIGASDIIRDITERKLLEARERQLFTANLVGVFVADFAGTFLEANDAMLDLLGYTREELQAGKLRSERLTPPEYRQLTQQAINAMLVHGKTDPFEKVYLHKSGQPIPVLVAVARIGDTDTCIGFVLDIRERKELEQRKDTFISMAGHELKTPLTSMKASIGLLRRRLASQAEDRVQPLLGTMDAQINRITRLIDDILDLSKIQTGQLAYHQEQFDFDALVREIVAMTQRSTQTHQINLVGRTEAAVTADRDRVGQVLTNLITNAVKYSPQADNVVVHIARDPDHVRVSVQDFGIGIAPGDQRRIFERFYRVNNGSKPASQQGLGLGLFLSQEIVTHHGGHLWVESKQGQGSTFSFTLPLRGAL